MKILKVKVTMFDGAVPAPSASASGGVASADDVQLHNTLIVSICKGEGGGVLEIMCSVWPDTIEINRLFIYANKKMLAEPYAGPEFKELDDELQDSLYDFLEVRGINDELAAFLHEYMKNKDKEEFIRWMEKSFGIWEKSEVYTTYVKSISIKIISPTYTKRFLERFKFLRAQTRCFCSGSTNNPKSNSTTSTSTNPAKNSNVISDDRYQQLENLDMMTAAKILFTDPPKKKKFGTDFHLVQLFFACLPSLAVYLVAQYARYEMRRMEVEVEQKRKQKEEEEVKEKEKEMELNPPEEKEAKSDPQLLEVKVRLDKLEEAVQDIVVVTKKESSSNLAKNQVTDAEKKQLSSSAPSDTSDSSASNKAVEGDRFGKHNSPNPKPESGEERKGSVATPNSSLQDPKGQNQGGGAS